MTDTYLKIMEYIERMDERDLRGRSDLSGTLLPEKYPAPHASRYGAKSTGGRKNGKS